MKQMSFQELTDDIIQEILLNVDILTVAKSCKTCSRVKRLCVTDYFWQLKHQRDFSTRYKVLELSWKESYIDWFGVARSGLFTDTVVFDGVQSVALFKSPVFPVDISISYTDNGEEHFILESSIHVHQNIEDTYYTDIPKGIFDIQNRNKGDPGCTRHKKISVTKEEASAYVKLKMKEGYIAYDISIDDLQSKIGKLRELGLTSTVPMFDDIRKWIG